jgi:DNA replication and repair protein RecF
VIISSLRTAAFRNLADAIVLTDAKDIFIVGENGQGKTNFLEAVYFCSYASSFRGVRDSEITKKTGTQEENFSAAIKIANEFTDKIFFRNVLVKFENRKKIVYIDGKKAGDRKELLSIAPCIVFCHEDMEFVAGSQERRRWFFDQVLSLYDQVYLDDLRSYRRILKSRNNILRENMQRRLNGRIETLLDALDHQYVLYGLRLMEKRETAAQLFTKIFAELYEQVSGIKNMSVLYGPSWKIDRADDVIELMHKRRAADISTGISQSGPHRDRYIFALGSAEFTGYASTGQRRLLALLLRVAQARRYYETTGKNPILLLDDVLLEMDGEKRRRFLSVLPGYDQAFFTFLPEEPFQRYRKEGTIVYYVKNGVLEEQ